MRQVTIAPPGDKSISHRALFIAALAPGRSEVERLLTGDDVKSTARVLRALGVGVSPLAPGRTVAIHGRGRRFRRPGRALHCGNSGTTARLLLGLLAAQPFAARLTGDRSLRRRPMGRVTEPLAYMGASFPRGGERLPLVVRGGPLAPIDHRSAVASAQVKTALLLAGLAADVPVRITEPCRSRDHTERLLRALGVEVREDDGAIVLVPTSPEPFRLRVPGDPSAAAFLVAAALLTPEVRLRLQDVLVNPTRIGFLDVLARMGAVIDVQDRRQEGCEPVADLLVSHQPLAGTVVDPTEVPSLVDEVPVLAVLASRARGRTVFRGVGELRVKESDRLARLAENLQRLGVQATSDGDTLAVEGTDRAPSGAVDTAGDHRLAMAFAVLGTMAGARVRLSERRSVAISYPGFFADLSRVTGAPRHHD